MQNSSGIFAAFTADGKLLWKHSMMEEFGRMTFPEQPHRFAADRQGPGHHARHHRGLGRLRPAGRSLLCLRQKDRRTGLVQLARRCVPQDNTFSHPWLSFLNGKRVFYSACGDSSLVCVNARTGEPLYRTPVAKAGAKGGINAAVVEHKGKHHRHPRERKHRHQRRGPHGGLQDSRGDQAAVAAGAAGHRQQGTRAVAQSDGRARQLAASSSATAFIR